MEYPLFGTSTPDVETHNRMSTKDVTYTTLRKLMSGNKSKEAVFTGSLDNNFRINTSNCLLRSWQMCSLKAIKWTSCKRIRRSPYHGVYSKLDSSLDVNGFRTPIRLDHDSEITGKTRRGGVRFCINHRRCRTTLSVEQP